MVERTGIYKRLKAMIFMLLFILTLVPETSFASVGQIDTGYDDNKVLKLEPEVHLSDEFAKVATQDDIDAIKQAAVDASSRGLSKSTPVFEENQYDEMVAYVRQGLANRQTTITVSYKTTGNNSSFVSSAIEDAMKHTGVGNEGDYIERSFMSWATGNSSGYYSGSQVVWTVPYNINYYTTKAQEDALATKIDEVLDSLNLDGKSDYEKFKLIYDYICANITYDNANLNNSSYYLKYTAYAALINKTAVCQGYACLLYRMLLDAGVDNRIITGLANGGAGSGGHAWNIVKPDAYWYYYVDSTWDATYKQAGRAYPYFLKSLANFGNHYPGTTSGGGREERIDEILATYPIAESNYVLCSHTWNNVLSVEKAATTLADGSKVVGCSKCIEKKNEIIKRIGNVTLSQTSYNYDGSAKTPAVTVADRDGEAISSNNYDVVYNNNVNVGTATVVVNFKNEYSGSVSRTFEIKNASTKPVPVLVAGNGKIDVNWNAVSGATNYRVYKYVNGVYTKVTDTIDTSCTIKNLNNEIKYGVLVRAYVNGSYSTYTLSDVVYAMPKTEGVIPELVAANGQIKVSWSAVSGATSYRVYKYLNGTYTKIADTSSNSYIINGLTNGTKYGVLVRAYINDAYTTYSLADVVYATPIASPIPKLVAGDEQIKVTWGEVSGATIYRVYKVLNGRYIKVADTVATSYTITGLINGTKYGVLVRACLDGKYTSYSITDIAYATPAEESVKSPIPKLTAGNESFDVIWDAVSGATSYRVYKYINRKYTKVVETTSTNYIITGLTNGTKYGVLVRACINGSYTTYSLDDVVYAIPIQ